MLLQPPLPERDPLAVEEPVEVSTKQSSAPVSFGPTRSRSTGNFAGTELWQSKRALSVRLYRGLAYFDKSPAHWQDLFAKASSALDRLARESLQPVRNLRFVGEVLFMLRPLIYGTGFVQCTPQ